MEKIAWRLMLVVFLAGMSLFVYGQTQPDFAFDELQFSTDYEKKLFRDFSQQKPDYLRLLCVSGGKLDRVGGNAYQLKLDMFLKKIKEKVNKRSSTKKVKFIFNQVQRDWLKQYKRENYFQELFDKGEFNCVSGSALYALILDHFEIPFKVNIMLEHVNIEAHIDGRGQLLESTLPDLGYLNIDKKYISEYVYSLVEMKVIPEEEYGNTLLTELYEKYKEKHKEGGLKELCALQFYNEGTYLSLRQENDKALQAYMKGYFISPSQLGITGVSSSLRKILSQSDYKNEKHITYLKWLFRLGGHGRLMGGLLENYFHRFTQLVLEERGEVELYKAVTKSLIHELKNSEVKNQLVYFHSRVMTQHYLFAGKAEDILPYLKEAYRLKPGSNKTKNLVLGYVSKKLAPIGDMEVLEKEILKLEADFPFLIADPFFIGAKLNTWLIMAAHYYRMGEGGKAEGYINYFENHFVNLENSNVDRYSIGKAYGSAVSYYFKIGNKRKSVLKVNRGLEFVPNNYDLQRKKQQLNQ